MENILVGNGINIQYNNIDYTAEKIILRMLNSLDDENYPCDYIIDDPMKLKYYMGELFLAAREALDGSFDKYTISSIEKKGLEDFKDRYSRKKKNLRIADIGFEDYYLIHDLLCHKVHIKNPEKFRIKEALKNAYLHSIYNNNKLNMLYKKYDDGLGRFLRSFDNIFTTNYDSNLESVTGMNIYHIHGQFDKLSEVYNPDSFRNHLNDNPLEGIKNEPEYQYLHSTALSTYCGDYKEYKIRQARKTNEFIEKMVDGYKTSVSMKSQIDSYVNQDNQILRNLYQAIKLKIKDPNLFFQEDYCEKEFRGMKGNLTVFGLSPHNDRHLFDMIDKANLDYCTFYYYDESECDLIRSCLSQLGNQKKLAFKSVKKFWETL
ncbi:hypothetical protein [Listeria costaricensis]|uniref:hypothetical protein n=1 Tax=Listeria costaricensis TaxID=2026604 RepID=UPI000C06B59E|nr:hypothetical protein [Listeria costaricensis]